MTQHKDGAGGNSRGLKAIPARRRSALYRKGGEGDYWKQGLLCARHTQGDNLMEHEQIIDHVHTHRGPIYVEISVGAPLV